MAGTVNEGSGKDLGNNCNSLDPERIGINRRLRKPGSVVFEPEEKHALEGERFSHGTDNRKGCENISGEKSGLTSWQEIMA